MERELITTVILKTITNKCMQDLRRANNHNLATIEDLQTFLNLIEETDEIDQYNNIRLKKPRFNDRSNNHRKQGRGNSPYKKDGHKHDWKDFPNNKYRNKYHKNHRQEHQRESSQERETSFEDRHESNMIGEQYESEDEFDIILPIVEGRYDSDSESESDSEDEESVVETHLLHKNILKKATKYYKEHRS